VTDAQPDDAAVRALQSLSIPDDVAARHLARLAAEPPANVLPLRPRRARAVRAGAAGLVAGVTLFSGAGVAAASTSRPGDALYGLKTARERLQLAVARHGDSRARYELRLARTRLAEAADLFRNGHPDRAVETLARADAALASARAQGSDVLDADVDAELDHRIDVLGGLLAGGLPDTAADAAREAINRAIDRGGRPTHPVHPAHPETPATHENGKPGPSGRPDGTPAPHPTPAPSHPGPDHHPTGKPTGILSHRP
jgi:hypothetical protein